MFDFVTFPRKEKIDKKILQLKSKLVKSGW